MKSDDDGNPQMTQMFADRGLGGKTNLRPSAKSADGCDLYLSPREVAENLPGRQHPHSILRWILEGLLVQGRRVRLAATRIGGRWWVAREDLETFLAATRGPKAEDLARLRLRAFAHGERSKRQRQRETRRRLERMGLIERQAGGLRPEAGEAAP